MKTATYVVELTEEEVKKLEQMQAKGKYNAREIRRARVLLLAHQGLQVKEIAKQTGMSQHGIINIKKRFLVEGLNLKEKPRPGQPKKLDKRAESYLVALACSPAPEGRDVWTMQLLADRLMEMQVVDSLSDETVRRALKKMNLSLGSKNNGA